MHKKPICAVAIIQLNSSDRMQDNIAQCGEFIKQAAGQGAQIAFLPENTFFMRREAKKAKEAKETIVSPDGGSTPLYTMDQHPGIIAAQSWASEFECWIVVGSVAVVDDASQTIPFNRCVVINAQGQIAGHYDKLHLFDVTLDNGESYMESARCIAGSQAKMVATPYGKIGLSICYDVRFPALFQEYARAGAEILSIPAAFTVPTGRAHWHVLQRARAIENGCFVIAAAQCGEHAGGRWSYGHSLAVNPWGEVLADLGDTPGVKVLQIDLSEVGKARQTIPNLKHGGSYTLEG